LAGRSLLAWFFFLPGAPWLGLSMYMNRIRGFYLGSDIWKEGLSEMTIDEQNDKANEVVSARLGQLNSALEKAQEKLQGMKLPCDVWHDIWRYECDETGYVTFEQIGMTKQNGVWTLCHSKGGEHPDGTCQSTVKPYRETSIEERITIAQHIDGLRKAVVTEKTRVVGEIEKALGSINSFLDH
jgi:hypothetical protein